MESVSTSGPAPARMPKRLLGLRSDEFLAARATAADDAAFEVLYERHVGGVLSFCRHMLGSLEEAEDAAQHSFAALHDKLVRSPEGLHLRAWLYTVARNRCLSTLRARRDRPDPEQLPQTAGLTDELERRADLRELLADLYDLPTDQRAALVLSELGDLTQAEVGEVLGTEAAKVKGLVFRARSGLIERREARAASCTEIRGELATARRGALRRGRLRHHLRACPDCATFLDELRRQRRMMALLLPVAPTVGLKRGIFAAAGLGTGAGAGSVALSKVVVIGAVAGTAAVAGGTAAELSERDSGARSGASESRRAPEGRPAGAPGAAVPGADRSARRNAGPTAGSGAPRAAARPAGRGGVVGPGGPDGRGRFGPADARRGATSVPPDALGRKGRRGRSDGGAAPAPGYRGSGRGPVSGADRPGRRTGQAPSDTTPDRPRSRREAPGAVGGGDRGAGVGGAPPGRSQGPDVSGSRRTKDGAGSLQPRDGS